MVATWTGRSGEGYHVTAQHKPFRAAELLGRRYGMFKDVRVEPPEQASREELAEAMAELGVLTKEEALRVLPPDSLPPSQH